MVRNIEAEQAALRKWKRNFEAQKQDEVKKAGVLRGYRKKEAAKARERAEKRPEFVAARRQIEKVRTLALKYRQLREYAEANQDTLQGIESEVAGKHVKTLLDNVAGLETVDSEEAVAQLNKELKEAMDRAFREEGRKELQAGKRNRGRQDDRGAEYYLKRRNAVRIPSVPPAELTDEEKAKTLEYLDILNARHIDGKPAQTHYIGFWAKGPKMPQPIKPQLRRALIHAAIEHHRGSTGELPNRDLDLPLETKKYLREIYGGGGGNVPSDEIVRRAVRYHTRAFPEPIYDRRELYKKSR